MPEFFLNSNQWARLGEGTAVTLQLLGWAMLLGSVMSLVMGVARLSRFRLVRALALVYVEIARGLSAIILLFIMFFAVPILFDVRGLSPMVAGVLALGLNMGAYGAEIVRGAIRAVPKGQAEATVSLNMTAYQRLRYVVLPQALTVILPPFGNLSIEILKGTALVSLITLSELAFEVQKLRVNRVVIEDSATTIALYLNALIIYFVIAQVLARLFRFAERQVETRLGSV
ncbi:MAG: amino acid ABC transporter permease [Actinomycetota bacterium]